MLTSTYHRRLWYCPFGRALLLCQRTATVSTYLFFVKAAEPSCYRISDRAPSSLVFLVLRVCCTCVIYSLLLLQRKILVLYLLIMLQCARCFFLTFMSSTYTSFPASSLSYALRIASVPGLVHFSPLFLCYTWHSFLTFLLSATCFRTNDLAAFLLALVC